MSQYNGLIGSTRIPGIERDEIQKFDGTRHVVVQRGANFYTVDILTEEGHPVDAATVKANMQAILEAPDDPDAPAIGVLTTAARDAWAAAREGMVQDATNAASLEQVDSALFAVCLEDASPANFNEVNRVMLHGDARNRWLDKSFQLIVAANGKSAVNFEHAWGDGVAVLRPTPPGGCCGGGRTARWQPSAAAWRARRRDSSRRPPQLLWASRAGWAAWAAGRLAAVPCRAGETTTITTTNNNNNRGRRPRRRSGTSGRPRPTLAAHRWSRARLAGRTSPAGRC